MVAIGSHVRPCALALLLTVIPSALSAAEAPLQHHPSEIVFLSRSFCSWSAGAVV